jgi:hypothetical protein
MYGTIPDVVISKPPRNNQFRVVVALVVGVMIGALGTTMMLPVVTKDTEAPTPAPRPILAMDPIETSHDLHACMNSLSGCRQELMGCASTSRPVTTSLAAMELDAQSNVCGADEMWFCKEWKPAVCEVYKGAECAEMGCVPRSSHR